MLRYKTKSRPGLVALYDIRPGNAAGPFLQPRSPHGARYRYVRTAEEGQISTKAADEGGAVTAGRVPDIVVQANVEYRTTTVTPRRTTEASTDITTITIIRVIIIIIVDGD